MLSMVFLYFMNSVIAVKAKDYIPVPVTFISSLSYFAQRRCDINLCGLNYCDKLIILWVNVAEQGKCEVGCLSHFV